MWKEWLTWKVAPLQSGWIIGHQRTLEPWSWGVRGRGYSRVSASHHTDLTGITSDRRREKLTLPACEGDVTQQCVTPPVCVLATNVRPQSDLKGTVSHTPIRGILGRVVSPVGSREDNRRKDAAPGQWSLRATAAKCGVRFLIGSRASPQITKTTVTDVLGTAGEIWTNLLVGAITKLLIKFFRPNYDIVVECPSS